MRRYYNIPFLVCIVFQCSMAYALWTQSSHQFPLGAKRMQKSRFAARPPVVQTQTNPRFYLPSRLTATQRKVEKYLHHLHVPKTAGTSLDRDLTMLLSGSNTLYTTSEHCDHRGNTSTYLRFMMFRNPLRHVFSQFFQVRSYTSGAWRPLAKVDTQNEYAELAGWMRIFANETDMHPNLPTKLAEKVDYDPRNALTRYLTCNWRLSQNSQAQKNSPTHRWEIPVYDAPRFADSIRAFQNLTVFGITELYRESVCIILDAVFETSRPLPLFCSCDKRSRGVFTHEDHGRHYKIRPADLSVDDKLVLYKLTETDRPLYRYAVKKFFEKGVDLEARRHIMMFCHNATELYARLISDTVFK